jgi:hypothetical protein
MTFLFASVIIFMLSSSVSEYLDNSNGHSVYTTTITLGTQQVLPNDTSTTKKLAPDQVSIDVDCLDNTSNGKLSVDHVYLIPQDDWLAAKQHLDPISVGILETQALEGAHLICNKVLESERYYNYQLSTEQEV